MKLSLSTEWLYFHLWKKNPVTNKSCQSILIPDTIIYRWAQPYFWYFTTKDGQILRKTKERIPISAIEETFNKGQNNSVQAMYMYIEEGVKQQQENILIEYFDQQSFNVFLHQREKALNAILQNFIEPKNQLNSLIKVQWSPQFCLLTRKTNKNNLKNTKIPIDDRIVTFEGAEHLSQQDSIQSPILSADIEKMCLNIVNHITEVSGNNIQVSRMVLYFKIDEDNKLWLLFCSNIKVRQKFLNEELFIEEENQRKQKQKERNSSPIFLLKGCNNIPKTKISASLRKFRNINGFIVSPKVNNLCTNCDQENETLYDISIKNIVEANEKGVVDEESKKIAQKIAENEKEKNKGKMNIHQLSLEEEEEDYFNPEYLNIPGIILKLWGKIDVAKFQALKLNESWLKLQAPMCLDCFLIFTQHITENEKPQKSTQAIKTRKPQYSLDKPQLPSTSPNIVNVNNIHNNINVNSTNNNNINQFNNKLSIDKINDDQKQQFSAIALSQNNNSNSWIPTIKSPKLQKNMSVTDRFKQGFIEWSSMIQNKQASTRDDAKGTKFAEKVYGNKQGVKLPVFKRKTESTNSISLSIGTHHSSGLIVSTIQEMKMMLIKEDFKI